MVEMVVGKPSVDPTKSAGARVVNAPFQIQSMQTRERWLKMLVYGRHGAGKTDLAGSSVDVESMRGVVMVDAESGDMTLADSDRIKNKDLISHIRVTNWKQVAKVQEYLKAHCTLRDRGDKEGLKRLQAQVTGEDPKDINEPMIFNTVIVDSLTEVETYCLYGIMSVDTAKVIEGEMEVAGWGEFRKNNEMVKLLVRAFRDLPMHVIFVCAESYNQDELKKFHYTPSLTGKLSSQVQGFVDIVGWLTIGLPVEGKEAPRRLYVQAVSGGPRFDAKNRRSVFKSAFFEDPTMSTIMKGIGLLK